MNRHKKRPAVFIDRDGTINVDHDYVHKREEWDWIDGAKEAIKLLNNAGMPVIIITNQSGIVRGRYTAEDVQKLHRYVDDELAEISAHVDGYYLCPHHPQHGDINDCDCRKPEPGMLLQAAGDHNVDLSKSYLIGDKESDIGAALNAGVTPILVATGYGKKHDSRVDKSVHRADNIFSAVQYILS